MNEIVDRVAKTVGIDEELAEKVVKIILELVRDYGPEDKVAQMFAKLPGADGILDSLEKTDTGGGMLGGLGNLGGLGGAMGAMGALNKMTDAGLSMSQVQAVGSEVLAYSRENAGEELVGEVVGAIPGLEQFL